MTPSSLLSYEDAPSTSCTEEVSLARQTPVSTRGVWKVAAAAFVTALIAVAGVPWTRRATSSDAMVMDAVAYSSYDTVGCSNWKVIEMTRSQVANKADCAAACTANDLCTSFNWQADACEHGYPKAKTCLLFKGACVTERNTCWEMSYKTAPITVAQTFTLSATGPDVCPALVAATEASLAAQGITGSTATCTQQSRRLGERRLTGVRIFTISWKYVTSVEQAAAAAYEFALKLTADLLANQEFTALIESNLPEEVTLNEHTLNADSPTTDSPTITEGTTAEPEERGVGAPLEVTILHVNDHHSHVEEEDFDVDVSSLGIGSEVEVKIGGFAMLATLARDLEANATNPIKIHAGDAITGSRYFSLFKGSAAADAMNAICFDSFTLGNHEFDQGDSGLAFFIDALHNSTTCKTPVLAANLVPGAGSPLQGKASAFTIKHFGDQSVAIVGVTVAGKVMESSSPDDGTLVTDEKAAAQATIDQLTAAGHNKIVLATHIGYTRDLQLASELRGVDVIIGADSHTLLGSSDGVGKISTPDHAYPTETTDAGGNKVCIATAWSYGHLLGQLSVLFDADGVVTSCSGSPKIPFEAPAENPDAVRDFLEGTGEFVEVTPDADIENTLDAYAAQIGDKMKREIGSAPEVLCLERIPGMGQSTLCEVSATWKHGSMIGQVVVEAFLLAEPSADIAILNSGGVRRDLDSGSIKIGDSYEVLPFGNTLVTTQMTGAQIKQVLEDALAKSFDPKSPSTGAYPLAARLRFDVDASQPVNGRISNLEVKAGASGAWSAISMSQEYTVVLTNYIAKGKDGYVTFATLTYTDSFTEYAEALTMYVESKGVVEVPPESEFSTQNFVSHAGNSHNLPPSGSGSAHGVPPEV